MADSIFSDDLRLSDAVLVTIYEEMSQATPGTDEFDRLVREAEYMVKIMQTQEGGLASERQLEFEQEKFEKQLRLERQKLEEHTSTRYQEWDLEVSKHQEQIRLEREKFEKQLEFEREREALRAKTEVRTSVIGTMAKAASDGFRFGLVLALFKSHLAMERDGIILTGGIRDLWKGLMK